MVVEEHQFKIEEPGLNGVEEHDPLENTPAPSDNSSQPQSHENSPYPDRKRQVREWHDGYKPSKKRKKSPRPGESTFRVPMSMEQRKSLGASVRPKEPQGLGIFNSLPVDAEITLLLDQGGNPIVPAMRGGMKLEFRAYGLPPPSTNSQRGNPIKLSPNDIIGQEQQTNHFYQYPLLNESSHNANLSEVSLEDGPKLAWWLAQQISQSSLQQSYGHMGSQVAEIPAQQFYGNETPSQSRKRQTDRERKARWREANTQRNRDNDLRARVNRQARIRLGDAETPEKSKWVINEIVRRRARRQEKQISQAAKSGDFPLFSNSETIRENLLTSSSEIGLHASAQRLRRLVVDVLFPAHDKGEASHRHQSLRVLSEAMSNGDAQVDENFQTVFANIAGHEVACNAIRSAMEPFIPEDDEEAEEEGTGKSHSLALDIPQNHIIVTLNKVLQLLRELDDIGNKQEKASLAKVTKAKFGARNPSQRDNRLHLKEFGISESQLEDFLVSINGGPLEPDSDDDLAAELFENDLVIEVPSPVSPQSAKNTELSDSDIWDIINQVLETFLERCLSKPKRGRRTKKSLADENRAKERAQKVEDLLMDIGIGSDRPLNDVESEAVSEFCIRLRSFKDTQSLGEDLPIPTVLAHCIPLPRCDPIDTPDANGLQKHKPTDDSIEIGHSPAAALALPDGTNPFADDDMAMPPSKNHRSILSSSPRNTEAQSSHTLKIVGVQHQTSPNSFDAQIPSYGSYPQFRPINALGSVHP